MALNQLVPVLQEALLNLLAIKGKPEIHEKRLRPSFTKEVRVSPKGSGPILFGTGLGLVAAGGFLMAWTHAEAMSNTAINCAALPCRDGHAAANVTTSCALVDAYFP